MGLGDARTATNTSGGTLRGSATYKGAAAGKYAIASISSDMHEGGHFTAMATLTADFDADNDAGTAGNDRAGIALGGMIDNFMTGDVNRPDWMVKLMADGGTADGMQPVANLGSGSGGALEDTDAADPLTTEWSTGGAAKGTGKWTVMFYGGADTALPTAVVGEFNAHIGTDDADAGAVGRLQGAFGANKMMDE